MPKPKLKTLDNGLRSILVPMEDQRTVTVLVLVECGSKYEKKEHNGISHFLEHMCFKGTTNRPNQAVIARELDGMGAEFNAFTGHEYTGYYAKVSSDYLAQSLDLIADIYCNSLFSEEAIEQERGAIVGEIDMYEDIPMRKVNDLFMSVVYGDQPAGWEIAGTKDLVTKFKREEFIAYRKQHYVPQSTAVVLAGKFDPKKVEKMIKEKFGDLESGKKRTKVPVDDAQTSPRVAIRKKESDQTHLVLGVRSIDLMDARYPAVMVLAGVLGGGMSSRLFQKVRTEMGLGYYVRAANDSFTDHGVLAASAGVVNERAKEAVIAILDEFKALKRDLVPELELNKVKDMLAGRLVLGLESSDEHAEYYGFQEILKKELKSPEEVIKKMRKVTAKDVQDAARTLFTRERLNLALIGPHESEGEFVNLLTL
jgi:predicted Zn-dependent peptidase